MKRVLISGVGGRMGKEVFQVLSVDPSIQKVIGFDAKVIAGIDSYLQTRDLPEKVDVVIDFSSPVGFKKILAWASSHRVPVVSGTTGVTGKDRSQIHRAARRIPIFWAPNMSGGVEVVRQALEVLAKLNGYEFQVEEIHHKQKRDRPSGTAILLQNSLEASLGKKIPKALSLRGGGVFGVHKIYAMGPSEMITIEHQALNRRVFAEGAVRAAKWLVRKRPGLYGISDLIK